MRVFLIITLLLAFFIFGWLANSIVAELGPAVQQPLSLGSIFDVPAKAAPRDHVFEDQIHVLKDRVVLDLKNVTWSSFTATDSMLPVLDDKSNGLEMLPSSPDEINAGDIVSYESDYASGIVIHRVIETGTDDLGWYAVLKGDNNPAPDPGRIRFGQIKGILVGVLY